MNKLPQMDFPPDKIKLELLYVERDKSEAQTEAQPKSKAKAQPKALPKITSAYTKLTFPPAPADRPYLISSLVLSADGKMAFEDVRDGPAIAKENYFDPDGALADFWVLNALRASSDAVIIGAGTLNSEPSTSGHILDPELIDQRLSSRRAEEAETDAAKKTSAARETSDTAARDGGVSAHPLSGSLNRRHPVNFVVSFDGTDIPPDHFLFNIDPSEQLPVAVMTSPDGGEYLQANFPRPVQIYDSSAGRAAILHDLDPHSGVTPVITTGSNSKPDTPAFLALLRRLNLELVLVESPSYTSHLMHLESMDEAFVNYSMIYAGGTQSPGRSLAFTHTSHPHVKIIALAMHTESFIYTRQRFFYGIGKE